MSTAEVTAIATRPMSAVEAAPEMSVEQMIAQTQKIQQCMKAVMKVNEHYGVIPGTNTKPTLLKPGAEKLCLMFRLDPQYDIMDKVETAERISFTVRCTLYHIPTGARIASGLGSCNSREKKYMRPAAKKCPQCNAETIFVSKIDGEPKYYCWKKKGGCGAKFQEGAEAIEGQPAGIEDPADLHNTILKMGCKRALVAAVLNGTAASDFFTQDLEDLTEKAAEYIPPQETAPPKGAGPAPTNAGATAAATAASPVAAATTRTATSGPTLTKPPAGTTATKPRTVAGGALPANDVPAKKGDPMSVQGQWARIGMLRPEIAGWAGDHEDPRHEYSKALHAYKTHDGKGCTSARHLTFDQAKNLIQRMEGKIASAVRTHAAMEAETGPQHSDKPAEEEFVDELAQLRAEIHQRGEGDDALECDIIDVYRVSKISDLHPKHVPGALALTAAWNTKAYLPLRTKIMGTLAP